MSEQRSGRRNGFATVILLLAVVLAAIYFGYYKGPAGMKEFGFTAQQGFGKNVPDAAGLEITQSIALKDHGDFSREMQVVVAESTQQLVVQTVIRRGPLRWSPAMRTYRVFDKGEYPLVFTVDSSDEGLVLIALIDTAAATESAVVKARLTVEPEAWGGVAEADYISGQALVFALFPTETERAQLSDLCAYNAVYKQAHYLRLELLDTAGAVVGSYDTQPLANRYYELH